MLRSNHHLVRPHIGGRQSFTQVFPSHHHGIAPATSGGAVVPPQTSTPAWLQQAYDLTYLSQTGGVGDTVAVVDAYDDPNAESDLATYRSRYGLPACTTANGCFSKLNQNGQTVAWLAALIVRSPLDPASYAALRLADESARGVGVWLGCARLRDFRPLLPSRPPAAADRDFSSRTPDPVR